MDHMTKLYLLTMEDYLAHLSPAFSAHAPSTSLVYYYLRILSSSPIKGAKPSTEIYPIASPYLT